MNFSKVIVLVLFLATCLLAEGVYVETLDEQKNSNNLLVLRVRIFNNTPITLHDALLKYCLVKSPNKTIEIENFYVEKSQISQYEVDSINTCVEIKIGDIPQGVFPNQDGFSIGIHYSDWSPRNKSLDFSNPQSSKFTKAENVALYIDDSILYGSDVLSQKNTDEDILPDATPLSAFDGGSVVLSPNEPYRFVWNYVDFAEKYQLTVLREDSSLVHSGEYFTNVADVRLSKGRYLWNVQSIRFNQKAKPLSTIKHYNRLNISGFRPSSDGFRVDWPDTIISTSGHKDTRLLNVFSVIVGANAVVKDIYSKGQVWVRNQATIGAVRYYAKPHMYETVFQDVILSLGNDYYKGKVDFNYDENRWPWRIPEYSAKITGSHKEKVVKSGECDTLKNHDAFKKIKVEAGGVLYFDEGEVIVDELQLDAGSRIAFVKPDFSTILRVNEKIQWNTSIANQNIATVASGFKLYYYGEERFFVHDMWGGTIIAPNAKLVLGQTQNKKIYGQFLGKGVTVHQYSKIFRMSFNPKKTIMSNTSFNVAWIGGRK